MKVPLSGQRLLILARAPAALVLAACLRFTIPPVWNSNRRGVVVKSSIRTGLAATPACLRYAVVLMRLEGMGL